MEASNRQGDDLNGVGFSASPSILPRRQFRKVSRCGAAGTGRSPKARLVAEESQGRWPAGRQANCGVVGMRDRLEAKEVRLGGR
jgi:hypothetical protein